jgi:hypothetical protein
MTALELTPEGQIRVMSLSVIQELIHERNKLELQRNKLREALRVCVWWAESVSRRITEDRESINWTGLQQARKALADIEKEEK